MNKNYHIVGIVCGLLLILMLAFIFKMETDKAKISEFLEYKDKYENNTKKMNQLVEKYNKNSTLSVERVNIIKKYLNIYDKRKSNLDKLQNYARENKALLESADVNSTDFIKKIDTQEKLMKKNIDDFKKELKAMNRSFLISYTEKQRAEYEQLVKRIKDY